MLRKFAELLYSRNEGDLVQAKGFTGKCSRGFIARTPKSCSMLLQAMKVHCPESFAIVSLSY